MEFAFLSFVGLSYLFVAHGGNLHVIVPGRLKLIQEKGLISKFKRTKFTNIKQSCFSTVILYSDPFGGAIGLPMVLKGSE